MTVKGINTSGKEREGESLRSRKISPLNSSYSFLPHHSGVAKLHYVLDANRVQINEKPGSCLPL